MERAAALAATPYQKAHTAAATDCLKRILAGDGTFTPDGGFSGHWNFFSLSQAYFNDGKVYLDSNFIHNFEWKNTSPDNDCTRLLGNDVYGILRDAVEGYIWNDEWRDGVVLATKNVCGLKSRTMITVERLESIAVAAGQFEDCLSLTLNITPDGVHSGFVYRTGKKEYFFAKGIGIVKCVHYFNNGAATAVYELTSFEGTGDGYMPVKDGLFRRYEALGLTKGYIANTEYTFCGDGGDIKVIRNSTGIRDRSVSMYSPDNWEDMILQIRQEYATQSHGGRWNWQLNDMTFQLGRAAALAETDYQRKHAAAASDVIRRMWDGDGRFTSDPKFHSTWNVLVLNTTERRDGKITIFNQRQYMMSWHRYMDSGDMGYHLIGNDLYHILSDAAGCIWSDEWISCVKTGAKLSMMGEHYPCAFADVFAERAEAVETAAGRFYDVIKISLDVTLPQKYEPRKEVGFNWPFLASRPGKKEYYFAKGVGIVKCVNHMKDGEVTVNYELASYEVTGDGYMPVSDGLVRRYEALGLTDGYVGGVEYSFCDKDGRIVIIENRTGIKK
jgi:hypothetical protein